MGTRVGVVTHYTFPQDGEYDIQIVLARNRTRAAANRGKRPTRPNRDTPRRLLSRVSTLVSRAPPIP